MISILHEGDCKMLTIFRVMLITGGPNSINSNCTIIIPHRSELVYVRDMPQTTFKFGKGQEEDLPSK